MRSLLQIPAAHVSPALHARPQAPQFATLEDVSTQVAPHIIRGALHDGTQEPITQPSVGAHRCPHTPQLAESERTSRSQPFAGLASQSPNPAEHVAIAHAPPAQNGTALGSEQAAPHALQLETDVLMLVSHPFVASPSQSPKLALHVDVQLAR
jgi:hypothetical protein